HRLSRRMRLSPGRFFYRRRAKAMSKKRRSPSATGAYAAAPARRTRNSIPSGALRRSASSKNEKLGRDLRAQLDPTGVLGRRLRVGCAALDGDLHLAFDAPAGFDLQAPILDRADDMTRAGDAERPLDHESAFAIAADLGVGDRCGALEDAVLENLQL